MPFEPRTSISADKDWKINFNFPVMPSSINTQNIYVTDIYNYREDIQVMPDTDAKTVIIKAPAYGYLPGQTYNLYVSSGIRSFDNKPLKQPVSMQFTIVGDVDVGKVDELKPEEVVTNDAGIKYLDNQLLITFKDFCELNQVGSIAETVSGTDGFFEIELPGGNYTAIATGEGYVDGCLYVLSLEGETLGNQDGSITPNIPSGQTRIVLTWGKNPEDLDSHLTGPLPDETRFHMSYPYSDMRYGSPWPDYVRLDLDDVTSYGPETTTIYQQLNGVYRFSVHDYTNRYLTNSNALATSDAEVKVYRGNSLIATYNVPPNQGGTCWTVFEMNGDQFTPINRIYYEMRPDYISYKDDHGGALS